MIVLSMSAYVASILFTYMLSEKKFVKQNVNLKNTNCPYHTFKVLDFVVMQLQDSNHCYLQTEGIIVEITPMNMARVIVNGFEIVIPQNELFTLK